MITIIKPTNEHGQHPDVIKNTDQDHQTDTEIGALLKQLRGDRTLRQVESETGISNSYLSNLELGRKNPGIKSLSKLAAYYRVPLNELLEYAGLPFDQKAAAREHTLNTAQASFDEVQRSYEFVLTDPHLDHYEKPAATPAFDTQKFVVRLYEHYTGRKLL